MISRANYFDYPAVSQSQLRDFARSPLHYYARHVAKTATVEETPAMAFGSAFHAAILEPDEWARYAVADWDARTKAGKEARDAALASGAKILSRESYDTIEAMREAIAAHPEASAILGARTHTEEPIGWEDPLTGIRCKAKPDAVCEVRGRVAIVDLKTTTDADEDSFSRSIYNFGYHVQAAMYLRGWREAKGVTANDFEFIAIEKAAPYAIGVYELDEAAIANGTARVVSLLHRLKICRETNSWPGYGIKTIGLPKWAA